MREGHDYLLYAAIRVALNRSEVICEYASTSWEIGAPGSNGPRCLIALTEQFLARGRQLRRIEQAETFQASHALSGPAALASGCRRRARKPSLVVGCREVDLSTDTRVSFRWRRMPMSLRLQSLVLMIVGALITATCLMADILGIGVDPAVIGPAQYSGAAIGVVVSLFGAHIALHHVLVDRG